LFLTVVIPALAITWGREDGQITFILYREPKLIAAAICSWLLLTAVAWLRPTALSLEELFKTLRRPTLLAAMMFIGYLATTGFWVRVPENHLYELSQYITLFLLLVVLLTWARQDSRVESTILRGLVLSLALVTFMGGLQWVGVLPSLSPINPQIGVPHPSLMGYKNPAALAILGQIFLLAYLVARTASRRWRLAGVGVLVLELAYLATLRSRTAYMALALGTLACVVVGLLRRPSRRLLCAALMPLFLVGTLFTGFLLTSESTRERAGSALNFVKSPSTYFDSDRGTYLLNTIQMVRMHPFGVGLGDWQTHYPVFRRVHRTVSFDDTFQVRRAHSDHVQFFGEAGWPGLFLWTAFLLLLIGAPVREHLRTGGPRPLFVSAQLVALTSAMATDYLLELPYNKFQFFLVVFLALAPRQASLADTQQINRPPLRRHLLTAGLLTCLALGSLTYHGSLLLKVHLSATMTRLYSQTVERLATDGRVEAAALERVLALGKHYDSQPGLSKTLHKDYLLLAHSAHLLGQQDLAEALAERSLDLHPYAPNALRLMAKIVEDPSRARQWQTAYEHIMHDAWQGFTAEYPESVHNLW
jgi:O-antigen ligase